MDLPAKLVNNLAFMIHGTALEYESYFDREMQALGLTRSQWLLLAHLYFCDGINQKELGDLMGVGKGAIGRLAQKLEIGGWIERQPDDADGRAFQLHIRPRARPVVRILVDMLIMETDRSLETFRPEEIEMIRDALRRIRRSIVDAPVSPEWTRLKKQALAGVRKLNA